MTAPARRHPPANARDAAIARESGRHLAAAAREAAPLVVWLDEPAGKRPIELPAGAVDSLLEILGAMAEGRGITLVDEASELTTVQAAELLNVSRPYLIGLIERGALPHRKVGKHRRVRAEDVMAFKRRGDEERGRALDALVADAQASDMGYRRR